MGSGEQDGVGHPRHGSGFEALPSAVAGRGHPEVASAHAVLHVAPENSVLDEDVRFRLVAFVVDVDGAAALDDGRVVDDRAELGGDRLADLACVVARAFPVEVGLEPVAYGLVEEDSAVSRAKDDLELARRSRPGVQEGQSLAGGALRVPLRGLAVEVGEGHPPAAAALTCLAAPVLLGDSRNSETHHGLTVVGDPSVARGDQDFAHRLSEGRARLHELWVIGEYGARRALEELSLLRPGLVQRVPGKVITTCRVDRRQSLDMKSRRTARDARRALGRPLHGLEAQVLDVGVAGRVALLDAHTQPHAHTPRGAARDPLLEGNPAGGPVFKEEVGVITPLGQGDFEQLPQDF